MLKEQQNLSRKKKFHIEPPDPADVFLGVIIIGTVIWFFACSITMTNYSHSIREEQKMSPEKMEIKKYKTKTIPLGDELARTIVVDGVTWYHEDDVIDAFFQLESKSYEQGFNEGMETND